MLLLTFACGLSLIAFQCLGLLVLFRKGLIFNYSAAEIRGSYFRSMPPKNTAEIFLEVQRGEALRCAHNHLFFRLVTTALSGQFHSPACLPLGVSLKHALFMRMGWPHRRSTIFVIHDKHMYIYISLYYIL